MGAARLGTMILLAISLALGLTGVAHADGVAGTSVRLVQSVGGHELTFTIHPVEGMPGPLQVDVLTHVGQPEADLDLTAHAVDGGGTPTSGKLHLTGQPGSRTAQLAVDRPGPWELRAQVGGEFAAIPFLVPPVVVQPWEWAAYTGFGTAGILLLASFLLVLKRPRWAAVTGATTAVALAVGITAALLSPSIQPPLGTQQQQQQQMQMQMAPAYGNLALSTEPAHPTAGEPFRLRLALFDGATGRPMDDLQVDHGALIHLALIGDDHRYLTHLHPARTGPGQYEVRTTLPVGGGFTAYAELARTGSGEQLLRQHFTVGGAASTVDTPIGLGERAADGLRFSLSSTPILAGAPATLTFRISDEHGPVHDLQPWLGMTGHLLLTSEDGALFEHVHERDSMATAVLTATLAQPDETVRSAGPAARFVLTFPAPGRYWLWLQVERDYQVRTVPYVVDVPAA
ncbi:hypothetical protein GCM10010174_55870 [Kutzneria viridogrisea]|uniref:Secreted protein n=1 Tax=Kutzneria viridogrisea TaxID=47990 RepID=A0ABR6BKU5_9PSEU|nr:hypothetical protein [Kutzneria viridogrisea]